MNLTQVSEALLAELTKNCLTAVYHGQVQQVHHQADKRSRLMTLTEPIRIVGIESAAQAQLAWVVDSFEPAGQNRTYGTGGQGLYTATAFLLVMSKKANTVGVLLDTLRTTYDVQVERVDANTLRVLREQWLVDVTDKNYDPALLAWAVRCRIGRLELMGGCL